MGVIDVETCVLKMDNGAMSGRLQYDNSKSLR